MGQDVTLFPTYSSKENRATNYTMMIFKMLYQHDVDLFRELFISLTNEEIGNRLGVNIRQQVKKNSSIPDGLISQNSFAGYIETKIGENFDCEQINRHIKSLKDNKASIKFLILLGNLEKDKYEINEICSNYEDSKEIIFFIQSFENVLNSLNEIISENQFDIPINLRNAIKEYEIFLDIEGLLPSWKKIIDVVNCSGSFDEVKYHNIYVCPNSGGSYSHRRAKYFGAYSDKKIKIISEIEAIIEFDENGNENFKWINSDRNQKDILDESKGNYEKSRTISPKNCQVFLLNDNFDVDFIKDTSGGMFGSKFYVFLKNTAIDKSSELAEKVNRKNWSDVIKLNEGRYTIL